MVEINSSGGPPIAIVRKQLDDSEMDLLADVTSVWLTPETDDFELHTRLHLPKLRKLYVAKCHQPLSVMITHGTLMGLETLIIADAADAMAGVLQIGELAGLETLSIREQQLEDEHLEWICQQRAVKKLALTDTNVADAGIRRLGCKQALKRLDLFRSKVAFQDDCLHSELFPRVRSLDVSETEVSGRSIEVMRLLFPKLSRLLAQKTQLTEADVRTIAMWDGLKVLDTTSPGIDFDHHGDDFWDL